MTQSPHSAQQTSSHPDPGARSPKPEARCTYVTPKHFLSAFGMETLHDLPDIEALEEAGLLS